MRIGRIALALGMIAFAAGPLRAQSLDRVEELARLGRMDEARQVLTQWWEESRAAAPQRDLQRGLWLRGRLTVEPNLAELDYQRLVVLYPSSPYAPQAILRLAQSAHANGDGAAAQRHVASIVRDYPTSQVRAEAEAWLRDAGPPPSPTGAPRAAPTAAAPAPVARDAAPSTAPPATPAPTPTTPTPTPTTPTPATSRPPAPADEALIWSVQFGAFTDEDRAFALHGELVAAGLAARLVRVAGSGFVHVRIGRFATRPEASTQLQQVSARGFDAAIVRDDRAEEVVRR